MTALPSFEELMASLGLDNNTDTPEHSLSRHSRSSSYSSTTSSIVSRSSSSIVPSPEINHSKTRSPSIIISRHETSSPISLQDWELERRRYRTRYSPYSPAISHARRGSMPAISNDDPLQHRPARALSTSPRPTSPRTVGRRSSALGLTTASRRPKKLILGDADLMANTPISTFLRRKTPQTSPISPTFHHRSKRPASPSAPVSIPILPTFFPQPSVSSTHSSDTEDDDMNSGSDSSSHWQKTPREAHDLTKPKYLRPAHRSESNLALRRGLDTGPRHRISPIA